MKRTNFLYVALATMTLATSCAQDDLQSSQAAMSEISFHANMGLKSRAKEMTTADLTTFNVSAFNNTSGALNYMTDVTYELQSGAWKSPTNETYYWPADASKTLDFYAYAPVTGIGTVGITQGEGKQKIEGFSTGEPATDQSSDYSDASSQVDLIYAVTPGQSKTSNSGNVSLNFKHALSEISVMALNTNSAYSVKVTGMKIGNVVSKGTYKLPATTVDASTTSTPGTWTLTETEKKAYTAIFGNNSAVTLTGTAQYVDGSTNASGGGNAVLNAFMLIPQQCAKGANSESTKYSQYSAGHYIALKVTITMKSGDVVYNDQWAYVGIDTQWEQGKHYTYVLDFSKGAGQQEDGNPVFGPEINISTVSITEWDGTSAGTKITYTGINGSSEPTVTKNT